MAEAAKKKRNFVDLPKGRDRIIRFPELEAILRRPRSSIYFMINRGEFPRGRKIGARAVGWMESDIDVWLSGR